MRIFEIILIITLLISFLNFSFLKFKISEAILGVCSILFLVIHLVLEKYRMPMIPIYFLTALFLIIGIVHKFTRIRLKLKVVRVIGISLLSIILILAIIIPILIPVVNHMSPSGEYAVGTMDLEFVDTSRKGVFTNADENRRIAVKAWYPADDTKGLTALKFFPNEKVGNYLAVSMGLPNLFGQLALTKTNSFPGAELSTKEDKYPVVLFSGGYGGFNGQNKIQMEELASNGYIVFSISHPGEDFASIYPDGSVIGANKQRTDEFYNDLLNIGKEYKKDQSTPEYQRYVIKNVSTVNESVKVWREDTDFVIDEIEKLNHGEINSIFEGKLDTQDMGLFGMSFGGAIAGQTSLYNSKIKAFINMDGSPFGDTYNNIISQPFMLLCGEAHKEELLGGYSTEQKNYLVVSIEGAKHYDFTDFTCLLPAFKYLGVLGNNGGTHQEEIMNDYVLSFFNKYLKGKNEPLIDQKLSKYEHVTVEER